MSFIALHFVLVCAVVGIKLPGPCPKALPTHDVEIMTRMYPRIIHRVPLSADSPSYLFRDSTPLQFKTYYETSLHKGVYEMVEKSVLANPKHIYHSELMRNPNSYTVNTTIRYQDDNSTKWCFEPIIEEIRVYFDAGYAFVWTCLDNEDGTERDEAVVVCTIVDPLYSNVTASELRRVIPLQAVAGSFMSKEIWNAIVNETDVKTAETGTREESELVCPYPVANVVVVVAILIIVLALLGLIWYIKHME